jgi:DNA-directed RNA polymerase specialized sigma54-like protein
MAREKILQLKVEHQKAFLEIGPEAMKPLVLRDVAEEVELHESTVFFDALRYKKLLLITFYVFHRYF